MMRTPKGFTLIEVLIVVVIIGILAGLAVSTYHRSYVERAKSAEALEVLYKAYAGYQRLIVEGESVASITWQKLGMSDPNLMPGRFFDYTIALPNVQAIRRGDAARWLAIYLNNATIVKTDPY